MATVNKKVSISVDMLLSKQLTFEEKGIISTLYAKGGKVEIKNVRNDFKQKMDSIVRKKFLFKNEKYYFCREDKKAVTIRKVGSELVTMFKDSIYYDYNEVEKVFQDEIQRGVDMYYYYMSVLDWSNQNIKKLRTNDGWKSTINIFMRKDKANNILQFIGGDRKTTDMINDIASYLNNE